MNKAILMGRLTRDIDLKYSQGAEPMAIAKFSIAINRRFKKDGEQEADFINCVAFGKTAEFICKHFSKGKMIAIVGEIRTNSWEDQSGQKRYSTEVMCQEVNFCGDNKDNSSTPTNTEDNKPYDSAEYVSDDENLPF